MTYSLADIENGIRALGLEPRGAFHCAAQDLVPTATDGTVPRSLVLIGTIGSEFWTTFDTARVDLATQPQPLDTYSQQLIAKLAHRFKATALFPFSGPPWLPFQRWAQRAESVHPSPIGPLIHPQFGLWHAYRGALSFTPELSGMVTAQSTPSPCDTCVDKPCLSTCPVGAFSSNGYAVPTCIEHLQADAGHRCLARGCLARLACPVGKKYRYQPEHAQFHMHAFVRAQAKIEPPTDNRWRSQ